MITLSRRVIGRWDGLSQHWTKAKRYAGPLLTLFVLGTLAASGSAARPATDLAFAAVSPGRVSEEMTQGRDLDRRDDLRWMQGSQSDLSGLTLKGATLTGADLRGADLSEADLTGAVLLGTHLRDANLTGAVLRRADLHYAVLVGADLQGADLRWANLQWTDLQDADLRDAQLAYAQLHRAHLSGAILPDGTLWKPGRDLARFTDPGRELDSSRVTDSGRVEEESILSVLP